MPAKARISEFANYNPFVNFIYFFLVIGFTMFFPNPVFLVISLVSAVVYSIILKGKRAVRFNAVVLLPVIISAALLNPAFNHNGVTILLYLPSGNPLTLESILYGAASGMMLAAVICWFSCFNEIMTSDKIVYIFGRIAPSLSLIFSMTLRFVPRFKRQFLSVAAAQKNIGRNIYRGKLRKRMHYAANIVSVMITWALENSIDTADSMKSRGFGLCGRTSFLMFAFDKRDAASVAVILTASIIAAVSIWCGMFEFVYFPSVKFDYSTVGGAAACISFFVLCTLPVWIELWEMKKWK